MREKKLIDVRMLTEAGIVLAIATILSNIKLFQAPNAGSVTLASMFPLVLFAIRWGWKKGVFIGAAFGLLSFIIKPEFYHPVQFLLDYILAYGFIGLSGLALGKNTGKITAYLPSVLLAHILRALCHFISGVVFFGMYVPEGTSPVVYSALYTLSYMGPETVLSIVFLFLLWRPLSRLLKRQ